MNYGTHLDLYSGIGGFSFAFESVGFRTIGFAETDPEASIVLDYYWPGIPNLGDVRKITSASCERPYLITGGVPCQPASLLGQRRGTSDERWLWPDTIRIMREFRPCFGVMENPTAILTLEDGRAWNGIISGLAQIGYDCWWDVFPAAAFGAGHLRERVILVCADASSGGWQAWTGLCESESCRQRRRRSCNVRSEENTIPPDSNGARLQGHTGNGIGGGGRSESRRPIAPADLRERVSCPDWWYEAHTGIPVLAHGLPSRLVEAISRCIGNSIVPQVLIPIAKAIAEVEHDRQRHRSSSPAQAQA